MPRSRSRSPIPESSRSRRDERSRRDDYDSRYRRDYDRDRRRGSPQPHNDRYADRDRPRERDRDRMRDGDRRDRRDDNRKPGYRDEAPGGSRRNDRERPRDYDSRRPGREDEARSSKRPSRSRSPTPDKAKPNFGNSGLLAAATNTVKHSDGTSTVLKYNEPPEARKPSEGWRMYVFKGKEDLGLLHIARQSAYLVGRDQLVADIPIDHPSCSKQHAVIQFRQVQDKDEYGVPKAVVKPFIIDLESTNGTFVNDVAIPGSRYYELKLSDVIKFGQSTREYVLLHEDVDA
ncbi:hypothetical protein FRB99_005494 [Tulasnella sp. 403]|nr:hypothetical protein FRB99_005494 [Tulasnella sp. 403]